ncbi:hypothetical protein [Bosea sp. BK604]|nr:hypothetical protein [Bosea sp. BK604]TCR65430.1 hypothetical protein EV560_105193 [Bosea sp. BK604]
MKRLVLAALALACLSACARPPDEGAGNLFKVLVCKQNGSC